MGICGSWAAALGDGGLPELARFHVFTNVAKGWKMAVYGQAALGDGGLPGLARFHVFTNVATGWKMAVHWQPALGDGGLVRAHIHEINQ